jgi:hypothetical protein
MWKRPPRLSELSEAQWSLQDVFYFGGNLCRALLGLDGSETRPYKAGGGSPQPASADTVLGLADRMAHPQSRAGKIMMRPVVEATTRADTPRSRKMPQT